MTPVIAPAAAELTRAEFLERLLNSTPVAVYETDDQGRLTWVNDAFSTLTGWPRDEAIGAVGTEFIPDTDRRSTQDIHRALVQSAGGPRVYDMLGRDGRVFRVQTWWTLRYDGTGRFVGVTLATVPLEVGSQIHATHDEIRAVLSRCDDAILWIDGRASVRFANEPARQLLAVGMIPTGDQPTGAGVPVVQLLRRMDGTPLSRAELPCRVAMVDGAPTDWAPFVVPGADGVDLAVAARAFPIGQAPAGSSSDAFLVLAPFGPVDAVERRRRDVQLEHAHTQLLAGSYLPSSRAVTSAGRARLQASLSSRQREVLALLAAGLRVPTIADRLYVSPHTVRNHLKAIFRLAGVNSQAELLAALHDPDWTGMTPPRPAERAGLTGTGQFHAGSAPTLISANRPSEDQHRAPTPHAGTT